MMKAKRQSLRACLFLVLTGSAGRAQTTVFVQEKVAVSRDLAGYADIGITKTPAEGITVALCSSDWSTVLASTQTDARGYFFLDTPKTGSLFYLRLSAPRCESISAAGEDQEKREIRTAGSSQ